MKKEELFELMTDLDENMVAAALPGDGDSRRPWLRWGALAACLCLVAGGAWIALRQHPAAPGGERGGGADTGGTLSGGFVGGAVVDGEDPGTTIGDLPDGMDPITASVAVFPAEENLENVETAEVLKLDESEAAALEQLGDCLPAALPEGFFFGNAYLYETTMKDGTRYHLLRVTYIDTVPPEPIYTEDGGQVAPDPNTLGNSFAVYAVDHRPRSLKTVYNPETITVSELAAMDGGTFYLDFGDCYVGIEPLGLSPEAQAEVIRSIGG